MIRAPSTSSAVAARRRWWLLLLLLAAMAVVAVYFRVPSRLQGVSKSALDWVEQVLKELDVWAPVVFVVLYVAACVALVPASFLTVGAGVVFGAVWGSVLVLIGATLGAAVSFFISRYLARDWVARRFGHRRAFVVTERAVEAEGWKMVFLTRLAPVFPFFVLNYAYGLTRVRFTHFILGTCLGIAPCTTLFVFIGATLRRAGAEHSTLTDWLKYGFILVTTVIAIVYIGKVARRALGRLTPPAGGPQKPDVAPGVSRI